MQQQLPCLPTSTGTSSTTATTTPLSGKENIYYYQSSLLHIFHIAFSKFICFSAQKERVFAYRAKKENLELPRIHLAINNRVIQYALRWALLCLSKYEWFFSLLCWNCLSILHSVLFHFPTHSFSLRSSKANRAMGDSVVEALFKAYKRRPEIFTKTNEGTIQVQWVVASSS